MSTQCNLCGLHIPDGVQACMMCGNKNLATAPAGNTVSPSLPSQSTTRPMSQASFSKWLWAIAISLIVAPALRVSSIVLYEVPRLFNDDSQAYLQSHPGFAGLLQFQIGMNALLVVAALVLNFLFYTRRKIFPVVMVAYVAATILFLAAVIGMINSTFPDASLAGGYMTLIRYLIWAGAIVPYLLTSNEVKERFVK
jgi:Protein of unknown function (DUF2569)